MNLKLDHKAKRRNLMATTVMAGVAALGAPAAVAIVTALAPTAALAQDYTAGTLVGHVTDSSGAPVSGAAVTVRSQGTGVTQNSTTDSTGTFRAPLIPTGAYSVTIRKSGYSDIAQEGLGVRSGGESNFGFTLTNGSDVDAVVVVAKRVRPQLDFSQTTTGLSVDVEQLAKTVPLARTQQALILLAPGALAGGGGTGNYATFTSLNGSSVSENAYFINGLNITNFNTSLGSANVPFDFYKSFDVKTGGFPAEFGRATGGVVTAVTKSGTNDFYFAVHGNFEPSGLRSVQRDTYQTSGKRNDRDYKEVTIEAGGPIIKDHLFFYGLTQLRDTHTSTATRGTTTTATTQYTTVDNGQPFYGAKLDGYLTSRQHLEATYFRTNDLLKSRTSRYVYGTDTVGAFSSGSNNPRGGENFVFKYTGTFTDWFTLSGAYGRSKDNFATLPLNAVDPFVSDNRTGQGTQVSQQSTNAIGAPYRSKRDFYRVDGDLYVNFLGKHHFRAGYDNEDDTLTHFSQYTGGYAITYQTAGANNVYGVAAGNQYAEARSFISGGVFDSTNEAWYVQDSWQLPFNVTINAGVRSDSFQQSGVNQGTTPGTVFINLPDNIAPRVGVTWDAFGDGSTKFFANYGKYFLPVAANTAFRQAAGTYDFTARFAATGGVYTLNPTTGLPNGGLGTQLIGYTGAKPCPLASPVTAAGVNGCTVQNDGSFYSADQQTSKELSATEEDEFIVGVSHKFNSLWSASATITYRNLVKASDDVAIDYAVRTYCTQNNLTCSNFVGSLQDYAIINPGNAATVRLQLPLNGAGSNGPTLNFTADQLGYPKPHREYTALDLVVDRAFDGKWSFHGSYTLSQLKGNYEGSSYSQYASGQTDSGITLQYDTPSLLEGAYGLLANHRAHQFKAYGSYQLFPSLLMGANATVLSPRKFGCFGVDPYDPILTANYGAFAHYCGGVLVPEGTSFDTPWTFTVDVSARYTVPKLFKYQGDLVLRADVFNIFNQRSTINAQEYFETSSGARTFTSAVGQADRRFAYGEPLGYQTPRYVRLGFDWVW